MAFKVTPLPYSDTALAPAISAETLSYHHGKHHKTYIDKTNAAIEGGSQADGVGLFGRVRRGEGGPGQQGQTGPDQLAAAHLVLQAGPEGGESRCGAVPERLPGEVPVQLLQHGGALGGPIG